MDFRRIKNTFSIFFGIGYGLSAFVRAQFAGNILLYTSISFRLHFRFDMFGQVKRILLRKKNTLQINAKDEQIKIETLCQQNNQAFFKLEKIGKSKKFKFDSIAQKKFQKFFY
eukprot:TRINITY_DN5775_c0_g1_i6.p4 TRINITY_DN5775_c0_g1~~TRINITY_DN5775_c0_g1_i6.p4  ORF type:complete len:113 (-),score=3.92 TRINITY_DN5775_c0_g1_i6:622-960(-)